MARRKLATFDAYRKLLDRRQLQRVSLIFFSDSGQGDALAALWGLQQGCLARAYIRRVDPGHEELNDEDRLVYFRDYQGVSKDLKAQGFGNAGLQHRPQLVCPSEEGAYEYAAALGSGDAPFFSRISRWALSIMFQK